MKVSFILVTISFVLLKDSILRSCIRDLPTPYSAIKSDFLVRHNINSKETLIDLLFYRLHLFSYKRSRVSFANVCWYAMYCMNDVYLTLITLYEYVDIAEQIPIFSHVKTSATDIIFLRTKPLL